MIIDTRRIEHAIILTVGATSPSGCFKTIWLYVGFENNNRMKIVSFFHTKGWKSQYENMIKIHGTRGEIFGKDNKQILYDTYKK